MTLLSILLFALVLIPFAYLAALAIASIRRIPPAARRPPTHRFLIAIAAHDEEAVIARTVEKLLALDYPKDLFEIHIVADHCTDRTAELARSAGAAAHERKSGPRTGKGATLTWLFSRILEKESDAVVIFDADTRVDSRFLRIMDARLAKGEDVIQGQHIIRNPNDGWFPALTWAMFLVDNRYQNQGRANLGLSAKHMGDSICFRSEVLRKVGWGEGLTEDYQLRQKLLLQGIRITYAPRAKGYGEAVLSWRQAEKQRARWIRGVQQAGEQYKRQLLRESLRRRDPAILDGALQSYLPAYSTLVLVVGCLIIVKLLLLSLTSATVPAELVWAWVALFLALFLYPLFGLMLEKAPLRAYLAILSGPLFIAWRTWLSLVARFNGRKIEWVRTQHGGAA